MLDEYNCGSYLIKNPVVRVKRKIWKKALHLKHLSLRRVAKRMESRNLRSHIMKHGTSVEDTLQGQKSETILILERWTER